MTSERVLKESKILIVDDSQANVIIVERMLEWSGYSNVRSSTSALEAVNVYEEYQPDLVILDLHMPQMSGYEVMEGIRSAPGGEFVPILVFTADITPEAKQKALHMGASDFLTKPGDSTEISLRVRNFLNTRHLHQEVEAKNAELESKVAQRTKDLWTSQCEILERLGRIASLRGSQGEGRLSGIGEMAAKVAAKLGWSNAGTELIRIAAPLLDVGTLTLPDEIVCKTSRLSPEEEQLLKSHTVRGGQVLGGGRTPLVEMAEQIARYHHECWDGTGYPIGLAGEKIPDAARIVAVVDAFLGSLHGTRGRRPLSADEAVSEIRAGAGTKFDPQVVTAFLDALGRDRFSSAA